MTKPIGHTYFMGRVKVPVYAPTDAPDNVYDVQVMYTRAKQELTDLRALKKLSDEQRQALVDSFAELAVMRAAGVKVYPIIQESVPTQTVDASDPASVIAQLDTSLGRIIDVSRTFIMPNMEQVSEMVEIAREARKLIRAQGEIQ